jgi:hypothetical protein
MPRSNIREKLRSGREVVADKRDEVVADAEQKQQEKRDNTGFFKKATGLLSRGINKARERVDKAMDSAQETAEQVGDKGDEFLGQIKGAPEAAQKWIAETVHNGVDRSLRAADKVLEFDDRVADAFEDWATNAANRAQERGVNLNAKVKEAIAGGLNTSRAELLRRIAGTAVRLAKTKVNVYQALSIKLLENAGAKTRIEFDAEESPIMQQAREREEVLFEQAAEYDSAAEDDRTEADQLRKDAAKKRQNGEVCGRLIDLIASGLEADGFVYDLIGLS